MCKMLDVVRSFYLLEPKYVLGEAVKLPCFPFLVEKEGKVAVGSQMRWIYFLSSFRSLFACLECDDFLLSHIYSSIFLLCRN